MKNLIVALAVVAMLAASASAAPDYTAFKSTWKPNTGVTGAWETASNWTSEYRPHDDTTGWGSWTAMADTVPLYGWEVWTGDPNSSSDGNIGTIEFSSSSTAVTTGNLDGGYNDTPAYFLMSGGLLTVNTDSNPYYLNDTLDIGLNWSSSKETPTFTQTGGTFKSTNSWAKVGFTGGSGAIIIKGGEFYCSVLKMRGTSQFTIDNSVGTPVMSFGTFDLDEGGTSNLKVVLNASGGSAAISATDAYLDDSVIVDDSLAEAAGTLYFGKTVDLIVASGTLLNTATLTNPDWECDPGAPLNTIRIRRRIPEPTLPLGVLAASVKADAGIGYDGGTTSDSPAAVDYGHPVTAYVKHTVAESMLVKGQARSYYDETGTHHTIGAIAYGQDHESDLLATGTLTVSKTIFISSSASGLPAGTPVQANAELTLNGLLRVLRDEGEGWPDANGLAAIFMAHVIKKGEESNLMCFTGIISLLGVSGDPWVQVILTGDADTAVLREARNGLVVNDDEAYLELNRVKVGFRVPAVIGQAFDIDIIFHAEAFVPTMAAGLQAEVLFGDQLLPEPSVAMLMMAGGLLALHRRRKKLNSKG